MASSALKRIPSFTKFVVRPNAPAPRNAYSTLQRPASYHFPSSSGAASIILSRNYSGNSPNRGEGPDRQLNDSFTGLLPRLLSLQNLFREKGRQMLSDLFLGDVIVTEQLFTGIKLYTDLQNPLLQKYQFNMQDFFYGSKEAFVQIQKAITMMHLMNHDLIKERKENYQLQEIHMGLLQSTLSPRLLQLIEKQLQEPINPTSEAFADYVINMNSLKLNSIVIEHVRTKVIDEAEGAVDEVSQLYYPQGSVLATVDIVFENDQVYEHCIDSTKPKVRRTVASKWQFQGCISGHVPLNWMIISMKHYMKNSTLQKAGK